MIHVFLGTNVGYKSYKILEKKYVGKSLLKVFKKKKMCKRDSRFDENGMKLVNRDSIKNKTTVDEFKSELMNSLYVDPLPKL